MKFDNTVDPIGLQLLRTIAVVACLAGGVAALFIWQQASPNANRISEAIPVVETEASYLPVMYTATWCGQFRQAKAYLNSKHIAYREVDVDTSAGQVGFRNTGERGVPVLIRDGEHFVGFSVDYYESIFNAPRDPSNGPGAS
jgi:glutaredoxin